MKSLIITIITFISIISCRPFETARDPEPFKEYIDKIPPLSLPQDFSYKSNIDIMSIVNVTPSEIEKYNPREIPIIGKINLSKDAHAIVYFYPADWSIPVIVTYTKTGVKIDSLAISAGIRDEEEHIYVSNFATINKDYSIEVIDTTITYRTDSLYNRIDSIGNQVVKNSRFSINSNGKIVKR